jgi:hypothetical protein
MSAAWAVQQAVYAALAADPALRVFDAVPNAAVFPYVVIGDADEAACGGGLIEHQLTLQVWSRAGGAREPKQIAALVKARLDGAILAVEGETLIGLMFVAANYRRQSDGETWRGTLRFRAVTETP